MRASKARPNPSFKETKASPQNRAGAFQRAFLIVLSLMFLPVSLAAHEGATGIVKERMDAMKDVGERTKTIASMLRGERPVDHDEIEAAAEIIRAHAEDIPILFPAGSTSGVSEAKPAIWTDWDRFKTYALDMTSAANAISQAARQEDRAELTNAFSALGNSCKACHEAFREKKH